MLRKLFSRNKRDEKGTAQGVTAQEVVTGKLPIKQKYPQIILLMFLRKQDCLPV